MKSSLLPILVGLLAFIICFPLTLRSEDGAPSFFTAHKGYLDLILFDPSDLYLQYIGKAPHDESGELTETNLNLLYFEADGGIDLGRDSLIFANLEYTYSGYKFDSSAEHSRDLGSPTFHSIASLMGFGHFYTEDLLGGWIFYPGIASDLRRTIGAKDMGWASGPVLSYRLDDDTAVQLGMQYSSDYYNESVYPIGGISLFSPDHRLHVNIMAPFVGRVGYRPGREVELYTSAWLAKRDYHSFLGPQRIESRVETGDLEIGIGALWSCSKNITFTLEGGVSFRNTFKVREGYTANEHPGGENAPYVSTAIGYLFD